MEHYAPLTCTRALWGLTRNLRKPRNTAKCNAVAALLLSGRNWQRRFPRTTLMMHGAPALVLAQHLGRNLRFKGSPRQAPSEHARPVLGQRTMEFTS